MATLKHAFNAKDMNSLAYRIIEGKVKTPDIFYMCLNFYLEIEIIFFNQKYCMELKTLACNIPHHM